MDVNQLVKEGYTWDQAQKEEVVVKFVETGNLKKTCELLGVSYDTAKVWRKQEWFTEIEARLTEAKNDELEARITGLVGKGLDQIEEVLTNGEDKVTKDGDVVKAAAPLHSLVIMTGTLFDKRQLLKEKKKPAQSANDILTQIADKLREAVTKPQLGEVIDVQATEVH